MYLFFMTILFPGLADASAATGDQNLRPADTPELLCRPIPQKNRGFSQETANRVQVNIWSRPAVIFVEVLPAEDDRMSDHFVLVNAEPWNVTPRGPHESLTPSGSARLQFRAGELLIKRPSEVIPPDQDSLLEAILTLRKDLSTVLANIVHGTDSRISPKQRIFTDPISLFCKEVW